MESKSMPLTAEPAAAYATTRANRHPDCWVCAPINGHGLAVAFLANEAGVVTGEFACDQEFVGYPGYLHGGVTSALLDGAMTNCLLARGTPGLTAKLEVRFLRPALLGKVATVRAWVEKAHAPLFVLAAELCQEAEVLATATGKFMSYPEDESTKAQRRPR